MVTLATRQQPKNPRARMQQMLRDRESKRYRHSSLYHRHAGLGPLLVLAVIHCGYRRGVLMPSAGQGLRGCMQLMPIYATRFGVH